MHTHTYNTCTHTCAHLYKGTYTFTQVHTQACMQGAHACIHCFNTHHQIKVFQLYGGYSQTIAMRTSTLQTVTI